MCVTGVLLAYEKQMRVWADRQSVADRLSSAGTRQSPEALIARVQAAEPDAAVTAITMRSGAAEPASVVLAPNRTLLVDPYTGAILGEGSKRMRAFCILLLAHGGSATWNDSVRALAAKVDASSRRRSHSGWRRGRQYLLGLRSEPPADLAVFARMKHGHGPAEAGHHDADSTKPVNSRVPIRMAADMAVVAGRIRESIPFASVDWLTVRDDAPAPIRDAATEELRAGKLGSRDGRLSRRVTHSINHSG